MHWLTSNTRPFLLNVMLSITVLCGLSQAAQAQRGGHHHGHGGGGHGGGFAAFPIVISPSGRPYGPTQAEYQYQRRYGHPSPGAFPGSTAYVNGYPAGYGHAGVAYRASSYGYGLGINAAPYGDYYPYGGYSYGYSPFAAGGIGMYPNLMLQQGTSALVVPQPGTVLNWSPQQTQLPAGAFSAPMMDPAFSDARINVGQAIATPVSPAQKVIEPSTPEQQIRAIRLVDEGDKQLKQIHYATAALKYRDAAAAARDQATPRFRLALTYAARSMFSEAIEQYRLGLALDPTWPQHAEHLDRLLGENTLAKKYLIHRIAEWTNEDIRDPQRLFLLGVVLHQDGDERSHDVLRTAIALAGPEPYLTAFFQVTGAEGEVATELAPAPAPVAPHGVNQPPQQAPPPIPVPPGPVLPQRDE